LLKGSNMSRYGLFQESQDRNCALVVRQDHGSIWKINAGNLAPGLSKHEDEILNKDGFFNRMPWGTRSYIPKNGVSLLSCLGLSFVSLSLVCTSRPCSTCFDAIMDSEFSMF
jgi:hypothetical protein